MDHELALLASTASGGRVIQREAGAWRLEIPRGDARRYRLAQLDDYAALKRPDFPWQAPLRLSLRARASAENIPGTWGFGLWNDPSGVAILGGGGMRLPALPNTAWFFFASPPNYLSLRDDLPARGGLAAIFRAPDWHPLLLMLAAPALPLLLVPPLARMMRRLARRVVQQDAAALDIQPTEWHAFQLDWKPGQINFYVDGSLVHTTALAPTGRLGLVIWVDNQFAAWPPDGRLRHGRLAAPTTAWIEVEELEISRAEAMGSSPQLLHS